jgi:hypothetical protein
MKIPQNLKLKDLLYLLLIFPVCLVAAALVSVLPSTASGPAEFILGWDANDEADLDGYEIYYRKGVPGATYKFLAEVYVDELEDPDNPMVSITDLYNGLLTDLITPVVRMAELANNSTYHFVLTAFDTQGQTSDFSEELCVKVIGTSVVECRSADSGGENDGSAEIGAGSGSSGGCFIAASSFVFRHRITYKLCMNVIFEDAFQFCNILICRLKPGFEYFRFQDHRHSVMNTTD